MRFPPATRLGSERARHEFVETLQRLIAICVDTAQRALVGEIPARVQAGDECLAVGAAGCPFPGGLLGEQRAGVDVAHELGQREQPRLGQLPVEFGPSGDRRVEVLDAARDQPRGVVIVGHRHRIAQPRQQCLVSARLLDPAPHIQTQDVVGALPDRVDLRVTQQPGHRPGLDVAIAAVDLDRIRCHGDPEPASLKLGDRHRDTLRQASGLAVVRRSEAVEHHRQRGFHINDHLGQLAAHQRLVDERPTECPPLPGVAQRFDQRAARVAEGERGGAQPQSVGQLHHAGESLAVGRARVSARFAGQQKGFGVDELDFTGGDRAGAELVLQPTDTHAVAGTVTARP